MEAFNDLKARGFIYQNTDEPAVEKLLAEKSITFYAGFDPTAASLHVGHLLPLMAMRRLQQAGHRPIVLVGGATALIGDPSGKQEARPVLTRAEVEANAAALKKVLSRFIRVEEALFVNNADWFAAMRYIDFLRDVGARFSINRMLTAESVRQRLETGLSFMEFSYMLMQAYDFYHLNREHDCRLQIGGQDQWGNIVAGVELTRKMARQEVYGVTLPLLTDSQGQKFGKTVAGAVWLDQERTSVFDYYQFWRNCADAEVGKLLGFFTALPLAEIAQLGALKDPEINRAKEILAYEATSLAHGQEEAVKVYLAAGGRFGFADPAGKIPTSSPIASIGNSLDARDNLPTYEIPAAALAAEKGLWIVKLLADSGLCRSNGEARRLIQGGGAYFNDQRISDPDLHLTRSDFPDHGVVLKAGKKNMRRLIPADGCRSGLN